MKQFIVLLSMIVLGACLFYMLAGSQGLGPKTLNVMRNVYENRLGIERVDE